MANPFANWTPEMVREFNERGTGTASYGLAEMPKVVGEPCGKEKDLHDQIEAACRQRGWPYIHSRMDMMSTISVGAPDFIVFAECGRTLAIECKTKDGKQTTEQKGWQMMLEKSGHKYHLIRSIEEFYGL